MFIDLPEVGRTLTKGEAFGTIESVKAVSELYSPVSGEIVGVNEDLADTPETVNTDPHETWMVAIKIANPDELSELLDNTEYAELAK